MYDGGKKYGEGTVCTVGMFDGVHRGHQLILRRLQEVAAERGLRPVAVTFDRHPRVVLGHTDNGFRLLTTNEERARLFSVQGMTTRWRRWRSHPRWRRCRHASSTKGS